MTLLLVWNAGGGTWGKSFDLGLPGAIVRPESKVLTGADLNQKSNHLARVKSGDLGLNICLEVNSVDTESFAP